MNLNEPESQVAFDLAIIVVSYNVRDLLERCLRSVAAALSRSALRGQIIVVDNASQDGSAALVRTEFPAADLIELDTNRGFAGGNNVALQALMGHESRVPDQASDDLRPATVDLRPRYVLLLNPDTEVVEDALDQLVAYLDSHPQVVVAGPQLRYADGSLQSSRRRFPTVGTFFWESTLLEQWWPRNPWVQRYRYGDGVVGQPQRVDWLVGAALLVRTAAIEQAGVFNEAFFMYSEELEWQSRLRRFGQIMYVPDAVIVHYEGKSSEQNMALRHINFNRSKLRYAQMRWGRRVVWPLRGFLLATYMLQLMIEASKWTLGHKRALRRERIVQYSTILRSGL